AATASTTWTTPGSPPTGCSSTRTCCTTAGWCFAGSRPVPVPARRSTRAERDAFLPLGARLGRVRRRGSPTPGRVRHPATHDTRHPTPDADTPRNALWAHHHFSSTQQEIPP